MNSELEDHICNLPDKDLVKMFRTPQDYRLEALVIAREEVRRRGGLDIVEEVAKPDMEEEERNKNVGKTKLAMALAFVPSILVTGVIASIFGGILGPFLPKSFDGHKWLAEAAAFTIVSLFLFVWRVATSLIARKIGAKVISPEHGAGQ